MTYYQQLIAKSGLTDREPRHIEAWMRIEHGTLDHLTGARFESEICLASACIDEAGVRESEALAVSLGL